MLELVTILCYLMQSLHDKPKTKGVDTICDTHHLVDCDIESMNNSPHSAIQLEANFTRSERETSLRNAWHSSKDPTSRGATAWWTMSLNPSAKSKKAVKQ